MVMPYAGGGVVVVDGSGVGGDDGDGDDVDHRGDIVTFSMK